MCMNFPGLRTIHDIVAISYRTKSLSFLTGCTPKYWHKCEAQTAGTHTVTMTLVLMIMVAHFPNYNCRKCFLARPKLQGRLQTIM